MSVDNAKNKYNQLLSNVGRSALSTLYPLDFELYSLGLELVDSNNKTVMYLTFPIMAESIQVTYPSRTSFQQTFGGVSVVSNSSFAPRTIQIQGNFGRSFKLDSSSISTDLAGQLTKLNVWKRSYDGMGSPTFVPGVHTGYGFVKKLQLLLEESTTLDQNNKPYSLFFYNLSLNENYRVVLMPQGVNVSQSVRKNMIWEYSFSLLAVSPIIKKNVEQVANNLVNSVVNTGFLAQTIKSVL